MKLKENQPSGSRLAVPHVRGWRELLPRCLGNALKFDITVTSLSEQHAVRLCRGPGWRKPLMRFGAIGLASPVGDAGLRLNMPRLCAVSKRRATPRLEKSDEATVKAVSHGDSVLKTVRRGSQAELPAQTRRLSEICIQISDSPQCRKDDSGDTAWNQPRGPEICV